MYELGQCEGDENLFLIKVTRIFILNDGGKWGRCWDAIMEGGGQCETETCQKTTNADEGSDIRL